MLADAIREQGAHAALIAVAPSNPASIKGIERAGFSPLYQLQRVRRRGKVSFIKTPFDPRFAAALNDGAGSLGSTG